jgi:hypothetical protein
MSLSFRLVPSQYLRPLTPKESFETPVCKDATMQLATMHLYATLCNYATMKLYATMCNYAIYSTLCKFMQLCATMQLMQLCNYETLNLYATLCN